MKGIQSGLLCSLFLLLTVAIVASGLAVMSIDLGSESLKIAIVSPGKPMEIILNTDSQRKTPLAVAFRDGDRLFGEAALSTSVRFPDKSYTYFLDLIGKDYESPLVQLFLSRFPYHNVTKDSENSAVFLNHPDGMTFTPEEILAMVIQKAKGDAELAAGDGQSIKDAVITVPPYFTQAERRSLVRSVQMAGLKVLQLMNSNTAVALNYGIFRRKDFNETLNYILFYEMGATSTVATVVGYQSVKTKERGFVETNPVLVVRGVGFDRTLGGLEMQIRLRDHLAKLFAEQTNRKLDSIRANKRAMAKLFKEAGRLKKVLSANTEHVAQVEGVMDDIDLKAPMKRSDLEDLCADLLGDRLVRPIKIALESSGLSMEYIDQVILFGGNTRMPKVQQVLLEYLKISDLGKSVNADEAAALGAAYHAAHLSKGFKVLTFVVKDANLYPIQVDFSRDVELEDGSKVTRMMHRMLFPRNNLYPSKKVLTFNRHAEDFEFFVNYGELKNFLTEEEVVSLGSLNITRINVKGLAESLARHNEENKEYKGTRAHFRLDESGILNLDSVETVFEAKVEEVVSESEESTVGAAFAKLSNTIGKLFGSGDAEGILNATIINATGDETSKAESQPQSPTTDYGQNKTENATQSSEKKPRTEIKIKTIKEPLRVEKEWLDQHSTQEKAFENSVKRLEELVQKDKERMRRDHLKNSLETFIVETKTRLHDDEYQSASTQEERDKILKALLSTSEWLDFESNDVETQSFEDKLHELMKTAREVFERVKEHQERPEAIKALNEILNISRLFYDGARNVSAEDQIFTEVEITTLGTLIDNTNSWLDESLREQERTPRYKNPTLLVRMIREKIVSLDREVKYLVNKARTATPKKKEEKIVEKVEESETKDEENEFAEIVEDVESQEETNGHENDGVSTEKPLELPSNSESEEPHSSPRPSPTIDKSHTEL